MSSVYMAPLGTVYWAVLRLTRWTVESVLCPCKVLSLHGAPYRAANMDGHKHGALGQSLPGCRYTAGTLSFADSGSGGSHHGHSC